MFIMLSVNIKYVYFEKKISSYILVSDKQWAHTRQSGKPDRRINMQNRKPN